MTALQPHVAEYLKCQYHLIREPQLKNCPSLIDMEDPPRKRAVPSGSSSDLKRVWRRGTTAFGNLAFPSTAGLTLPSCPCCVTDNRTGSPAFQHELRNNGSPGFWHQIQNGEASHRLDRSNTNLLTSQQLESSACEMIPTAEAPSEMDRATNYLISASSVRVLLF